MGETLDMLNSALVLMETCATHGYWRHLQCYHTA